MIILGVDPGTNLTGFGIIENGKKSGCTQSNFVHISSGVIKLPAEKNLSQKLEIIYDELAGLIKRYRPDEFAIETAFYGKNVQSAMKIGYARGVSLLAAVHNGIPSSEYSPREIKKSIVGRGAASKEQVCYMIKNLLSVNSLKMKYDESDALAVALCHAFRMNNFKTIKSGSWKSFVEKYPDRVINP
ncbi:MAG TPA: crossover junction endodeoxyribonuclease RuvC [Ignavibacteriaceae bacterium]|nr:crossover junction endodeoxyribonuclease RuvC [Ignavibacteriaceae bacterium]